MLYKLYNNDHANLSIESIAIVQPRYQPLVDKAVTSMSRKMTIYRLHNHHIRYNSLDTKKYILISSIILVKSVAYHLFSYVVLFAIMLNVKENKGKPIKLEYTFLSLISKSIAIPTGPSSIKKIHIKNNNTYIKWVVQANIDLYNINFIYCWQQAIWLWQYSSSYLRSCLFRKINQSVQCCFRRPEIV